MTRLNAKAAIITGAGRGFGRRAADASAREGANVVLCARSETELAQAAEDIRRAGHACLAIRAGIGVPDYVDALIQPAISAGP